MNKQSILKYLISVILVFALISVFLALSIPQASAEETQGGEASLEEQEAQTQEGAETQEGQQTQETQESQPPDKYPCYLKIGLNYASTAVESFTVECDDGFIIATGDSAGWVETDIKTTATSLVVSSQAGKVVLSEACGTVLLSDMDGYLILSAAEGEENKIIRIDGKRYRGGLCATAYGFTKLNIINYVELEQYLRGCIPTEMPYYYPHEALMAQAVTARSYACMSIGAHSTYGFDLCSGQHCQVYKGVSSERESTDLACSASEGLVITHEGKLVRGYYFAGSGGCTLNSEDVWVSALPYCREVKDEFYEDRKWQRSISFEDLQKKLEEAGHNIGALESVQITKRSEHGAVKEITLSGSLGSCTYTKTRMTGLIGARSFVFAIAGEAFIFDNNYTEDVPDSINLLTSTEEVQSGESIFVIGMNGELVEISLLDVKIYDGIEQHDTAFHTVEGYRDQPVFGPELHIAGNGTLHGVGMPQTSARNMANAGYNFE
ncbi:MAG: SpoIID/LytB domain-containing protein, partial [Clostridiales bacterium]|nr:SpoIID/LytB domain-containing protein [Clostridiales bacterium]